MSAPRFSLRMLLGFLVLVCVLLSGIAAAYREREEDRDAESYGTLLEAYQETEAPYSLEQPGGGDRWLQHWGRLLRSERGRRYIRRLDELSPFVAFDESGRTVYYVTQPWRVNLTPPGDPLARVTRVPSYGPAITLRAPSFDPELRLDTARALFSDPPFAGAR